MKGNATTSTNAEIAVALNELLSLDRDQLATRWQSVFGTLAPHRSRETLLRGALAWHLQMVNSSKASSGGVDIQIRRLRRSTTTSSPKAELAQGTRLFREWQDETHQVTVLATGFEYKGKTYNSLSAIARQITGIPWSGPAFFGLKR